MLKQPEFCNIENLCNTLVETYNTSVLDRADIGFEKACLKEAKRCSKTDKAKEGKLQRDVLARLINNHYKQYNKPVSAFIGGPFTLTVQWSEKYKKLIYIFGEHHKDSTDCNDIKETFIGDYLDELIRNTDVFIDFYIELPGFKGEEYQHRFSDSQFSDQTMFKIGTIFQNCIQKSTRDTYDCELARSHYLDIRVSEGIKLNNVSFFLKELNPLYPILRAGNLIHNIDIFLDFFSFSQVKTFFMTVNRINTYEEFLEFWFDQIDQFELLQKKVAKSTNEEIEIIKYIKQEIEIPIINNPMSWEAYVHIVKEIHKKYYKKDEEDEEGEFIYDFRGISMEENTELLTNLIRIHKYFNNINALIPDGYLLGRIFKDFNIDSDKKPTDEPKQPHNIIIYAGNGHSNRYRKFLEEKLDFKLIEQAGHPWRVSEITGKFKNCIEMKEFKQPFFSNYLEVDWLTFKSPVLKKNPFTEWNEHTNKDGKICYNNKKIYHSIWKVPPDYYMSSKIKKNPLSKWTEAVDDYGEIYYEHKTRDILQRVLPNDFYIPFDDEDIELHFHESEMSQMEV